MNCACKHICAGDGRTFRRTVEDCNHNGAQILDPLWDSVEYREREAAIVKCHTCGYHGPNAAYNRVIYHATGRKVA